MRRLGFVALCLAGVAACGSTVQTTSTGPGSDGIAKGLAEQPTAATGPAGDIPSALVIPSARGSVTGAPGAPVQDAAGGPGGRALPESSRAIPATGSGWTRSTVYIGVTTQQDVQAVAQSAGISSVDSGDQKADVEAILAHVNREGGLFGRKVQGLYFDVKTTGDAETQSQAACSYFTQDNRVVAVYAAALVSDTPSFRACMAKARIPVLAGGAQAFDDKVFEDLDGYYHLMPFPSWSRFARPFVDRLVAQRYFTGWDTRLGQAGTAPVKVGFLCPDTVVGRRVGALVRRELTRVGHAPTAETYFTTNPADVSGYVLRFQADGITHVIMCDLGLFVFAEQAESQHYRPRYGVSTFNTPVLFLQGVVPPGQLNGSLGSGFVPTLDVDDSRDPGPSVMPEAAVCRAIAAKSGISYSSQQRFARAVLYDTCDIVRLIVAAARSAGALDGPGIRRGIATIGASMRSAVTFVSGLSATVHANPAATRDIYYDSACQCYRYRGGTLPMS